MTTFAYKNRMLAGVIVILISAFSFASLNSLVKIQTSIHGVPVSILLLAEYLVSLIMILPFVVAKYGFAFLIAPPSFSEIKKHHLLRTFCNLGASLLMFESLNLGFSYFDASMIYNLFPLFIPFVALILLGNKINHALWPFIIIGFLGVALSLHLDNKILSLQALLMLISAILGALSVVLMRKIVLYEDIIKTLYHFFLYATIMCLFMIVPDIKTLFNINWFIPIVIGILFFVVQYCLVLAAKWVHPSVVANVYYSNIIFASLISYFFLKGTITLLMVIGMFLIIIGGLGVVYIQKRNNKK
ncbi:DMT family transporter [Rickettsiales bacterium LUAb2]